MPCSLLLRNSHPQFLKARNLNSSGFKIALDLLVKCSIPNDAIAEVPFSFGVRTEGESKLTGKVIMRYLEQLAELYWYRFSGVIVFLVILLFVLFVLIARALVSSYGGLDSKAQSKY